MQTLTSWKFLDNNLAWTLFNHGCALAKEIGIFDVDNPAYTHDPPLTADQRFTCRIHFWQLYQFDSSFSLQAGKASAIPDGSWTVALPTIGDWMASSNWSTVATSAHHQVIFFTLTRLAQVQRKIAELFVGRAGEIVEQADCETLFTAPQHPYSRLLLDAEPAGDALCSDEREIVLQVDDLSVQFPLGGGLFRRKTWLRAVDGISLSVQRGKTLGIVGESGSGKSTLGQAILRLLDSTGSIRFQGEALDPLNNQQMRPWRKQMQVVFQDPFGSLSPRMSVEQIISEGLEVHAPCSLAERDAQVIQVLKDVGLDPESRHRYPHEFSGGQRQRIAIARALVLKPALMLLDEPTSALDRTVQKQVVALLRELQEKYGLTYLFISHDLAVVRAMAHDMIVIKDGKVVERGASHVVFDAPQHPYTKELLAAAHIPL